MRIRLALAMGLLTLLCAPRPAAAGDDAGKKQGEEETRLERKCDHEDEKDRRDEARNRRHPRPDNKWDELCVPPPPPVEEPPAPPPPVLVFPPEGDTTAPPLLIFPPPPPPA